jgi:hypothetical protein
MDCPSMIAPTPSSSCIGNSPTAFQMLPKTTQAQPKPLPEPVQDAPPQQIFYNHHAASASSSPACTLLPPAPEIPTSPWTLLLAHLPCLSTHCLYGSQLQILSLMHLSPTKPCSCHRLCLCHSTWHSPRQHLYCQTYHLSHPHLCFRLLPPHCLKRLNAKTILYKNTLEFEDQF